MRKTKHDAQPAIGIVSSLGGCRTVAKLVAISPSAVSRWCTPTSFGGTGGRIPQKYWPQLAAEARLYGIDIDAAKLSGFF